MAVPPAPLSCAAFATDTVTLIVAAARMAAYRIVISPLHFGNAKDHPATRYESHLMGAGEGGATLWRRCGGSVAVLLKLPVMHV